jgi:hypothetical protein
LALRAVFLGELWERSVRVVVAAGVDVAAVEDITAAAVVAAVVET